MALLLRDPAPGPLGIGVLGVARLVTDAVQGVDHGHVGGQRLLWGFGKGRAGRGLGVRGGVWPGWGGGMGSEGRGWGGKIGLVRTADGLMGVVVVGPSPVIISPTRQTSSSSGMSLVRSRRSRICGEGGVATGGRLAVGQRGWGVGLGWAVG